MTLSRGGIAKTLKALPESSTCVEVCDSNFYSKRRKVPAWDEGRALSMLFRLLIPGSFYEAMVAQALEELPNECCGFLAGALEPGELALGRVTARYPLVNDLASPTEYA